MKKFLLFLTFVFSSVVLFGQDIIVTKDAKRIDAKVLLIDDIEVKYVSFANPDGPVYRMLKTEIASIVYPNGYVDVFNNAETLQQQQPQQQQQEPAPQPQETAQIPLYNGVPMSLSVFKKMDDDDIDNFFEKSVGGDIYDQFHSGMRLGRTGKSLFIPGVILAGAGFITAVSCYAVAINSYYYNHSVDVMYSVGLSALFIGEGLVIASIPLRAIGGAKKRSAKNDYIDNYLRGTTSQLQPALNFGLTTTGVGLTVIF